MANYTATITDGVMFGVVNESLSRWEKNAVLTTVRSLMSILEEAASKPGGLYQICMFINTVLLPAMKEYRGHMAQN